MKKIFSLAAASAFSLALTAATPALVIGDGASPIALSSIRSIQFAADQITVNCVDGTTLSESLQAISFCTIDDVSALRELSAQGAGSVCFDLMGRPVSGDAAFTISRQGIRFQSVPQHGSHATRAVAAKSETALQLSTTGIEPMIALSQVDSICFDPSLTDLLLYVGMQSYDFSLESVSGITFPELSKTIRIEYADNLVKGVNPHYFDGVGITAKGAHVLVRAEGVTEELEYELSGSSADGSFKIYSGFKWQATLQGLTLTNPQGPAINSQSGKKGTIKSQKNTVNVLCDGAEYAASDEDQKGCIFSEGQLIFSGKGELQVTSLYKHAICSDDYVSLENGKVTVLAAASDAIHANDSIIVQGCNVTLTPGTDGLDTDGPVLLRANENGDPKLTITTTGDGAKGIKCGTDFEMSAGDVLITQTGKSGVKSDGKKDKVTGIKADNITITGGHVTIHNTAEDGKAYSADSVVGKEFITVE